MPAALAPAVPYLATAAIAWAYYRRIRRHFGRQQWQPRRTAFRLAIVVLALAGLATAAVFVPRLAPGVAIGALIGAGLGVFALRHTHAEWIEGNGWYTPNPWIGGALSVLLLGRLAWRWSHGAFSSGAFSGAQSSNAAAAVGAAPAMQQASPLTLGIAAALIGYSLVNGAGLWWRMRQLRAAHGGNAT